jgi:hypothetical protein
MLGTYFHRRQKRLNTPNPLIPPRWNWEREPIASQKDSGPVNRIHNNGYFKRFFHIHKSLTNQN